MCKLKFKQHHFLSGQRCDYLLYSTRHFLRSLLVMRFPPPSMFAYRMYRGRNRLLPSLSSQTTLSLSRKLFWRVRDVDRLYTYIPYLPETHFLLILTFPAPIWGYISFLLNWTDLFGERAGVGFHGILLGVWEETSWPGCFVYSTSQFLANHHHLMQSQPALLV